MKKVLVFAFIIIAMLVSMITPTFAANDKEPKLSSDIVRVDFVHYARPEKPGSGKQDPGYKLMGVKWAPGTQIEININTTASGIDDNNWVYNTIVNAADTWNDESVTPNLFYTYTPDSTAAYGVADEKNSIAFGAYSGNSNVIAVTSVWFYRKTGYIAEFDMLFNTAYIWGDASVDAAKMDLQNIATHEFGHSVGLSDIYNTSFSYVTMYGYSFEGDLQKIDLAEPDKLGMIKIYGQ